MQTYLCNFAYGDAYKEVQQKQHTLMKSFFANIFEYDDNFVIKSGFYEKNKTIFDQAETGFGYCSWKPLIILDALTKIEVNDTIVYMDVADYVYNPSFYSWLNWNVKEKLNGKFFNINYYIHGQWTTRDCFIGMNCDTDFYHSQRQLEAGTLAFQKTDENIAFLNEWLYWNQKPEIICKNQNFYGQPNLPGFIDHRTDQSILTNLFYKYGFKGEFMENCRAFIQYNFFEQNMNLTKHQYK
jgi:hypothetical protein